MRDHTPKPGEVQQLKELLPALIKMLDGYQEQAHASDTPAASGGERWTRSSGS